MMMAWFLAPPKHCARLPVAAARSKIYRAIGDKADEADGADVRVVEDGVHRFLVAIDDIEDARRQAGLDHQLRQHHRHPGIALRRFENKRIAAGDGRREFPHRDHRRKIERRDAGDDAEWLPHRVDVDAWTGAFDIFALHQVRNAAGEFDHLEAALNVVLGIGNCLAVLARQPVRELVVIALREFEELHHDAGAALRIGRASFWLRRQGVLDRRAQFALRGQRDLRLNVDRHRFKHVGKSARLSYDFLAADKVSNCLHAISLIKICLSWRQGVRHAAPSQSFTAYSASRFRR
jgi:hypothetical protein